MKTRATALLLCAIALTACSSNPTPPHAIVTGIVRGYGGPEIIGHGKPHSAINGQPETNQPVTAKRSDGLVVKATTDSKGRYGIGLPAGTYVIKAGCSLGVTITVHSGEHLREPLRCDFP